MNMNIKENSSIFNKRHASVATVMNTVDTNVKTIRNRVNEGFEKIGINFSNVIK